MFLLFHNAPLWLMFSLLVTPLSIFLVPRGIYVLVKGKSKRATIFVIAAMLFSFLITAYFLILGKEINDAFLSFSIPFGIFAFLIITIEKSMFAVALSFLLGVFFNACAFASLIEYTEKLCGWRKQKFK